MLLQSSVILCSIVVIIFKNLIYIEIVSVFSILLFPS